MTFPRAVAEHCCYTSQQQQDDALPTRNAATLLDFCLMEEDKGSNF